ncbi:50s ribosomal protein l15 [Stylonychia lemnae]|uniref:50s ribosomal protein l15 n=1 Tax=Stylonychia lemnae TaxID=5949 RepID=A0A078APB9_STYLE|nr:50s ribosomal protein l15 [Stylonychia lemnae]|eukprot:CDW84215.1 50s ribosomal protein l15 [Stylonychia lemnae]
MFVRPANLLTSNQVLGRMLMMTQNHHNMMLMGAIQRCNFVSRAPNGLTEYQAEAKELLPFNASNLWDNIGARQKFKRVGRGPGSGLGAGGQVNRGFEGGQSSLSKRFPKRGMKADAFNNKDEIEILNLGQLAYYISKGFVDASKTITMKDLVDSRCLSSVKDGVKLLSRGAESLQKLGVPINIEVSNATKSAIEAIKATGGEISVQYRTPLIMRYHLKPHKFNDYKTLKTPMPPQKKVVKLEKLREKGLNVAYPRAPWYTDNKEAILKEASDTEKRINEAQHANLLKKLPADRNAGQSKDIPKIERKPITKFYKFI